MSGQGNSMPANTAAPNATPARSSHICYEIPWLEDSENFAHWHFCMKMVLQDHDLLPVVNGTLAKPNATTDPDAYRAWIDKYLKARIQIATMLRKGPLNLIMDADSAKSCWDKLTAQYQGKGGCCIGYLMESFFKTPLTDTEPLKPQMQKLIEANRNLDTIGCGVNDKNLAYIIIMALPESMSTLKTILFNKDNMTITSEEVMSQILADEERRVHTSGGSATAYYAKVGKKGTSGKN